METLEKLQRKNDIEKVQYEVICYSLLLSFVEGLQKSSTRKQKSKDYVQILSLLYSSFTLKELNSYLSPHDLKISPYHWRLAHLHRVKYGAGITRRLRFKRSNTRVKLSTIKKAASFAKSSQFFKANSYGTHHRRLSNGKRITLPTFTRKYDKNRIYVEYKAHIGGEQALPKKQFYSLLDAIGPRNDSIIAAMDTYSIQYGSDNFAAIAEFITFVIPDDLGKDNLLTRTKQVENYLKTSFKAHLTNDAHSILLLFFSCFQRTSS